MLFVSYQKRAFDKIAEALKGHEKKSRREMAIAINEAAADTKKQAAKLISMELATAQKNIKKVLATSGRATPEKLQTTFSVKAKGAGDAKGKIPLRDFGARHVKKGVSYKISKTEGRKSLPGAFMGPKPGIKQASFNGRAFIRKGKSRVPIQQPYGPSPWGVLIKKGRQSKLRAYAKQRLKYRIKRRVRFVQMKAAGKIPSK